MKISNLLSKKKDKFKSNLERNFAAQFALPYEDTKLLYIVTHMYNPDFTLAPNVFVECKGRFLGADRNKHLYVRAQNPHIRVLFVFQDPAQTLTKKSKTTYGQWCDKNNFPHMSAADAQNYTAESLLWFIECHFDRAQYVKC